MKALLTDNLPLLAGAPNGIKKLRELILELAVQGKLVPQDPSDEPASELLKLIAEEKAQSVAEGKIKKQKPLATVETEAEPFELPAGWKWSSLAQVAFVNPRNAAEDSLEVSFVPMTFIGTRFDDQHTQEPRLWGEVKQGFTHFAEGDIGVAKITPCFENSKACVFSNLVNNLGAGTTELHIVRPVNGTLDPRYVLAYLKSPQFLVVGETKMTGTAGQKRLPKDFVEANPFPLPPLAEQHRIVAKVDELMALCDRLEAQQTDAESAHAQLVQALLGSLTQTSDATDFAANWQRLAEHFHTLFTTEPSIDALKQTLLQLAVMGKLVPQDPNDEPASAQLKRIANEKVQLFFEGRIKKQKKQAEVCEEEKPFKLPDTWEWVRLGEILSLTSGKGFKAEEYSSHGARLFQIANVSIGHTKWEIENFLPERYLNEYPELVLKDGDVLIALNRPLLNGKMKVCIISEKDLPAILYQRVGRFRFYDSSVNSRFFYYYLQSHLFIGKLNESLQGSDQPFINQSQVVEFLFSWPPLAEQHRIVAKVDQLRTICDQLKGRLAQAREVSQQLADALAAKATSGSTATITKE